MQTNRPTRINSVFASAAIQQAVLLNCEKLDSIKAKTGNHLTDTASRAAAEAALTMMADWETALAEGTSPADLPGEVDKAIAQLIQFRQDVARAYRLDAAAPALEPVSDGFGRTFAVSPSAEAVFLRADTVTVIVEREDDGVAVSLTPRGLPFQEVSRAHLSFVDVEAAVAKAYGTTVDDAADWAHTERGIDFASQSLEERLSLIRQNGACNPADRGFHRIPDEAVERHFLSGAFFVTEAAQTEVMALGLDRVLSWFNRPVAAAHVGQTIAMDEFPLQAFFGMDQEKEGAEAFYVAISLLKPANAPAA
ncbi:hypothetical protein [Noviherbaspirillum galbum]|uniref:Uncharacterized protein n=1 Tax=Noviherbaspirillum galbum TaxID=2709383 RepID=A0A6B3SL23_9BURK|nr:hypothetical protein [Noviherbaspirillum galbum]NEX60065.1 hypothetical protein [Noviherbaspirillum galbum]